MNDFDVIVVGGGHAGCEAAFSAAKLRASVCLITFAFDNLGELSCNPSIGGVAKGIIVQEVDALGGMMGEAADYSGIHFKILNRSKGQAVWGLRAQVDRALYKRYVQDVITSHKNIHIIQTEVIGLLFDKHNIIRGVRCVERDITAKSVVLTNGTFLNGIMRTGLTQISGGRYGEKSSIMLAQQIKELKIKTGRLKTGTPPRLFRDTIHWDMLEKQTGDIEPYFFSYANFTLQQPQLSCYITHTTPESHDILRRNTHLSPLMSGTVTYIGPRYCPSIEDKITRFKDKDSHLVFLEPEGLNSDIIYPGGISTSMPDKIQLAFLRAIPGLENVIVARYGYLVAYDFVDPTEVTSTLEVKNFHGLFLAGQIIGTTGYEEAAGLGIMAGINAVLSQQKEKFLLSRADSYIGVMVDDLISTGTSEPYRMMTSRAEHRIFLRPDNVTSRLTQKALVLGLIDGVKKQTFEQNQQELDTLRTIAYQKNISPQEAREYGYCCRDGITKTLYNLLSNIQISPAVLKEKIKEFSQSHVKIIEKLQIEAKYYTYNLRHKQDMRELLVDSSEIIPNDLQFEKIGALSNEVVEKLKTIRPYSIAEMKKIQGITPTALIAIKLYIKKLKDGKL